MLAAGQKLFLSEEQKDIEFYVGVDADHRVRFPAHKLILSACSPVFSATLSEKFKEGETGKIVITDVAPSAFRSLLQFAYIGTFEDPTVFICRDILFAADKYLMSGLSKFCFSYLKTIEINLDNFWSFLNFTCLLYSESMPPEIVTKTLQYLDINAEKILKSGEFLHLDYLTVSRITKRSSLKGVNENRILERVFQWCQMECCRQNLPITAEYMRKVVGDIKYDVRFLLVERDKLLDDATNYDFLMQNEKQIILKSSFKNCGELPFPWNNDLLKASRGKNSSVTFNFDCNEEANVDMTTTTTKSLLLVVSSECVIEALDVTVLPENKIIQINVEITDLEGNMFYNWCGPESYNAVYKVRQAMCLKKFTAYKINVACIKGQLVMKDKGHVFCDSGIGRPLIFLGDFPNGAEDEKFQSRKFWKNVLSRHGTVSGFCETTCNSIVKSVTFTI